MSKIISTKVHVSIGNPRSMCGLNPQRGDYHIASWSSFFSAPVENQCEACINALERRGYNTQEQRQKFRAVYDRAEALGMPAHILPNQMQGA